MVSIDYGKSLRWDGRGSKPQQAVEVLTTARRLAAELQVPIRVHHAPARRAVFDWLLSEGVTLIGAEDLKHVRPLLESSPDSDSARALRNDRE